MVKEVLKIRVAFADTDGMGVAWHGNYLRWFEMGRTELIRFDGFSYLWLVERDIHLPVIEACCRYHQPAKYDDVLTILAAVEEMKGVRLRIAYEIRAGRDLIATGYTEHAFIDGSGKVIKPPKEIVALMNGLKGGGA